MCKNRFSALGILLLLAGPTVLGAGVQAKVKELEAQTIAQAGTNEKKEEVRQAFASLERAIDKISGKSPGTQPADQFLSAERDALSKALSESEKATGLQVVVAVLEDNHSDDVVRQTVFKYLGSRKAFSLADLDVLCHVLVIDYGSSMMPQRAWVKPPTIRQNLGAWVGEILKVEIPNEGSPLSKVELENHPRDWLQAMLSKSLEKETNEERKAIIRRALLSTTGEKPAN